MLEFKNVINHSFQDSTESQSRYKKPVNSRNSSKSVPILRLPHSINDIYIHLKHCFHKNKRRLLTNLSLAWYSTLMALLQTAWRHQIRKTSHSLLTLTISMYKKTQFIQINGSWTNSDSELEISQPLLENLFNPTLF